MKKFLAATALLSVTTTAAFANPNYPVEVVKDGVIYNCAADLTVVDGVQTRSCVTVGGASESGGGLFALAGLGGIGGSLGLVAAVVTVGVIAVDDDDNTVVNTN